MEPGGTRWLQPASGRVFLSTASKADTKRHSILWRRSPTQPGGVPSESRTVGHGSPSGEQKGDTMSLVMLGVDPHKQSHTATPLVTGSHQQLASLRVPASASGYRQLLEWACRFPQRRWAIENARGLGCHLTQWLLARGETVQDVRTTGHRPGPRAVARAWP
jgi:hypothetical protein